MKEECCKGKHVSRKEAIEISRDILEQAEKERILMGDSDENKKTACIVEKLIKHRCRANPFLTDEEQCDFAVVDVITDGCVYRKYGCSDMGWYECSNEEAWPENQETIERQVERKR